MKKTVWFIWVPLIALFFITCKKDEMILRESSASLTFSRDTVHFDTVFTSIGSTTQNFRIYNTFNQALEITTIELTGGESSFFRLNVDGVPGTEFHNIIIPAEDSLYVFVEVTLDPNMANLPLIVTDSITFLTNGNLQDVDLVAWGQDAHFYYPDQYIEGFPPFSVIDCDEIWFADKPYVIYGYAVVDEGCSLTIEAGTHIHFHSNSGLWVYRDASLQVNGLEGAEVVFQGDRLENDYDEIPGQWDRIWINEGSLNNEFNYAIIKNNFIGIQAENLVLTEEDLNFLVSDNTLKLNNCEIRNNSAASLFLRNYRVEITNSLVTNAGQYNCAITGGGSYNIKHSTFANYWKYGTRSTPSFFISNQYEDVLGNLQIKEIFDSEVVNSVMYGNTFEEFSYEFNDLAPIDILFRYNLVKLDETTLNATYFDIPNMFVNQSPGFFDIAEDNFQLMEGAYAKDKGFPGLGISFDLNDTPRDGQPDLGCYECCFVE